MAANLKTADHLSRAASAMSDSGRRAAWGWHRLHSALGNVPPKEFEQLTRDRATARSSQLERIKVGEPLGAASWLKGGCLLHLQGALEGERKQVTVLFADLKGSMELFGAPIAQEDHALRACYAALSIQDSVKRYAEEEQEAN